MESVTLCVRRDEAETIAFSEQANNKIKYSIVADSAECAMKLNNGKADFGIFNAEELLLIHQFYPSDIVPIYELRPTHKSEGKFMI